MLTDNSTQAFLQKLYDKQREHSNKLYTNSLKENRNVQSKVNCKAPNKKLSKAPSSQITTPASTPNWCLDVSACDSSLSELMQDWICLPQGVYRFRSIIRGDEWGQQIQAAIQDCIGDCKEGRKCIIIEINCLGTSISFTSSLIKYALPLLKFGKSTWSVAALSANRRFDMLSLDSEGSPLWKAKNPLSKIQLEREQLFRRVFGYAEQKQKNICIQQMLGKVVLPNSHNIYFILKTADVEKPVSRLLIEQEMMIQSIANFQTISILSLYTRTQQLGEALAKLGIVLRKEDELPKGEKQEFLKCLISKLEGELLCQKEQLQHYIESDRIEEEQYSIPSQRLSMEQKYRQLQRNIRQKMDQK